MVSVLIFQNINFYIFLEFSKLCRSLIEKRLGEAVPKNELESRRERKLAGGRFPQLFHLESKRHARLPLPFRLFTQKLLPPALVRASPVGPCTTYVLAQSFIPVHTCSFQTYTLYRMYVLPLIKIVQAQLTY